jgi:hypothetical protein
MVFFVAVDIVVIAVLGAYLSKGPVAVGSPFGKKYAQLPFLT